MNKEEITVADAVTEPPKNQTTTPEGFLDFPGLAARVPLGERTLREEIRRKRIPSIRLPGARRLLFHWPSVLEALKRHQSGGPE